MQKIIAFALCGCIWSFCAFSQSQTIDNILNQVEQNNKELKALSEYKESKRNELKSSNNLPDPQFGAYYLSFGDHSTGDYTEFQFSQSFEFPSIYRARGNLIDQQSSRLQIEFRSKKQEILAQAKNHCLNLVYLGKLLETEKLRMEKAKQVYEQVKVLYNKEQVGILELNKAKVSWMQEQFAVQEIKNDRKKLLTLLENLNGGNEVLFTISEYSTPLNLVEKDSLWQKKLNKDPELLLLKKQERIAEQKLKVTKQKSLPNLTAGFNSQGISGNRYSGLYAGISIPLWSNRNKVKAAQSQIKFQQSFTVSRTMQAYAAFENQYNDFLVRLAKFQEYQTTLSDLDSEALLFQAYELGEISFLEYFLELKFYRQAYDAMLEMQYQLYLSQTELLKHQL